MDFGSSSMATYNLSVKVLDGTTLNLKAKTPTLSGESIKRRVFAVTGIPTAHQLLVAKGSCVHTDTLISSLAGTFDFPTVSLLLRLVGGKGGFGSLLRGAATKAGQKKTNNFDACRDMSGRRLRHVNAEKKLEEWQAEAEDRRLEKIAEDFIKKKARTGKKVGDGETDKYVEKYRKESAACVEVVEASVREAIKAYKNSKRKAVAVPKSDSKKLKIWMGKKKLQDSDSEDDDEDSDDDREENIEKSIVLDDGVPLYSTGEDVGSSSSVSCGKADEEFPGGTSSESGPVVEKEIAVQGIFESDVLIPEKSKDHPELNGVDESFAGAAVISETEAKSGSLVDSHIQSISCSGAVKGFETVDISVGENAFVAEKSEANEEIFPASKGDIDVEKPLNLDEFNSATEMEGVGLERLKWELQARGLKCGGTLQERASRLFLLKTTPPELLPKKLLAKK